MSQDHLIQLECTECKRVNYQTKRNKKSVKERMERNKHCPWCRKHTPHKETK